MFLRAASAVTLLLAGLSVSAGQAWAQYYPSQPPQYRQLPPVGIEDDDDDGLAPLDQPGIFGRPGQPGPYAAPPRSLDPSAVPDPRYSRPLYPQQGNAAPPGAIYREELPPAGHDLDQRYRDATPNYGPPGQPNYGAQPAPGQPNYGSQQGPGQPPGQSQDAFRPPQPIGPGPQPGQPGQQGQPGQGQPSVYSALPPEERPETGPRKELPPQFRRTTVDYQTKEPVGTIIIDTANTYLFLVLGNGKAMRYGIGVGREGFTWTGAERVSRMAEWPDWHPPSEMIERQPYLPRFMAGGEGNPLGARALYLGKTLYRIHGTNQPSTIGSFVSSGCIRLTNEDIADLYYRVNVGTRVVVLPGKAPAQAAAMPIGPQLNQQVEPSPLSAPPARVR
jgi:lipoprotein-anchoring transpeptidase ErfK/SrfK